MAINTNLNNFISKTNSQNGTVSVDNKLNTTTPIQTGLQNDVYVSTANQTQKKKSLFKTVGLIGLASIGIAGSIIAIKKSSIETAKIKEQIIESYNKIFDDMSKEVKNATGIDLIKPDLKFKKLEKNSHAYCNTATNTIFLNARLLRKKSLHRYNDPTKIGTFRLGDGTKLTEAIQSTRGFKRLPKDSMYIEGNEKLFAINGILAHELTHARQTQIMLNGENALEKFLEALKKNNTQLRNLDTEKFLEMFPFFKEYKPQRTIGLNDLIIQKTWIDDKSYTPIGYKIEDIINAKATYTSEDYTRYRKNILEIEAESAAANYYKNYKDITPDLDIPEDVQKLYNTSAINNIRALYPKKIRDMIMGFMSNFKK